jgi:N-acyl-D-aspartate/D-glutamate deacylase
MAAYDLLIKGGTLVDGTGAPKRLADVAIKDGIVANIGRNISAGSARTVIDASGKIVAPGVVDAHTHYDAQLHWDPYCTNSSWHGTTTVVVGNCGFGFMPCRAADRERYMRMMENTEQVSLATMRKVLKWEWETYPEWIAYMGKQRMGVNVASYLPLNSLLMYVMGVDEVKKRPASKSEKAQLRDHLHRALDAGALGFGFSHLGERNSHRDCDGSPMPTDIMAEEDIYNLAEVLRERDEGVIQALVDVFSISNSKVVEQCARISGRPVLHNVTMAFDVAPNYHRERLAWLDSMEAQGLDIYSQALLLRFWLEFSAADFHDWGGVEPFAEMIRAGGAEARARIAADPDYRARAIRIYRSSSLDGMGGPLESLKLQRAGTAVRFADLEGKSLGEIAVALGKPCIEVYLDIVAQSGARADFRTSAVTSTDPQKITEILTHKRVIPGTSDGGAHLKFYSGGQYSTDNIQQMVREERRMTLEQIHYKLSWLPARILGLPQRGALLEGYAADFYVYDFEKLSFNTDRYDVLDDVPGGEWRRVVKARGVEAVGVNGNIIFKNGEGAGAYPGRLVGPAIGASA